MIIDANKISCDGYNEGSCIGAVVEVLGHHEFENSFTVDGMIADTGRIIDFYTTKELIIAAAKDLGCKVKIETVNKDGGWSRYFVVHILA